MFSLADTAQPQEVVQSKNRIFIGRSRREDRPVLHKRCTFWILDWGLRILGFEIRNPKSKIRNRMNSLHPSWTNQKKIVIGMLHLPALPGAPLYRGDLRSIRAGLLRDAHALAEGGVQGLMMENFGDVPFYPDRVPANVVSHMTALAAEVRRAIDLPLGINVLRNDGRSALAVASAVGASFIRVNVLCGARVADQGLIQGIAHDLLRERSMLGATDVKIFADVDVKHSAPLAARPLHDEVDDLIERALADAIVVSGAGTGKSTDLEKVRTVKRARPQAPLFIGSGITAQTITQFLDSADGFIVGTALKKDCEVMNPVDLARVKELMRAIV
jgi:membrane complex biogenesis BtpA family protein